MISNLQLRLGGSPRGTAWVIPPMRPCIPGITPVSSETTVVTTKVTTIDSIGLPRLRTIRISMLSPPTAGMFLSPLPVPTSGAVRSSHRTGIQPRGTVLPPVLRLNGQVLPFAPTTAGSPLHVRSHRRPPATKQTSKAAKSLNGLILTMPTGCWMYSVISTRTMLNFGGRRIPWLNKVKGRRIYIYILKSYIYLFYMYCK
mmetsp:Transcript_33870/g.99819  ORF Transcript_33870/g.99819 Transcript_33870/m.99819 type:complete len:200 (-) Transcript_33870:52-651(-)